MALHKGEEHEITRNHWDHKGVFFASVNRRSCFGNLFCLGYFIVYKKLFEECGTADGMEKTILIPGI